MNAYDGSALDQETTERRWKLVVADDTRITADSLSDLLRMMGHQVVTAYDGTGAIAAHADFQPDAYILDLGMPGMDGYQTCRAIRNLAGGDIIAIIAVSGWGRTEDLTNALEAGFSSFLLKPAHPNDILRCLSGLATRRLPPDRA